MLKENVLKPRMKPNKPGKLNIGRTIVISFSFFTVLLAWSYFNFKVPLLLEELMDDFPGKDLVKGIIMALDNMIAILLQPLFGNLSDRMKSRFGRRMPFIILGTLASVLFFVMIPLVKVLAGFILVVFLFDLAMSIYRTPALVLLPDYTPDEVRSSGSSVQQFIANTGGVIGFAVPMIISALPIPGLWEDQAAFLLCGAVMLAALILQIIVIRETPTGTSLARIADHDFDIDPVSFEGKIIPRKIEEKVNVLAQIGDIFRKDKNMVNFLMAALFWYLGFAAVEAFFSSFAVYYLGKATDAEASSLFMAYSVPMILFALPAGFIGQKMGRKRALVFFQIWMIASVFIMSAVVVPMSYKNCRDIIIMGMLAMISIPWMGIIVNSFPLLWSLPPEGRIGSYTGVYYTFNQAAYSLSPVLMGLTLSLFSSMGDRKYLVMFPYVLICLALAFFFLLRIKKGRKEDLSRETLDELDKEYGSAD